MPGKRDYASELNNRAHKCSLGCATGRNPKLRARMMPQHYLKYHKVKVGAFICSACTFVCPKSGMCIAHHISRTKHRAADVYYTFSPTIDRFEIRGPGTECSPECKQELIDAKVKAFKEKVKAKQQKKKSPANQPESDSEDSNLSQIEIVTLEGDREVSEEERMPAEMDERQVQVVMRSRPGSKHPVKEEKEDEQSGNRCQAVRL